MWVTNTRHNEKAELNEKYFENEKYKTKRVFRVMYFFSTPQNKEKDTE
jgi:hypothetical protein